MDEEVIGLTTGGGGSKTAKGRRFAAPTGLSDQRRILRSSQPWYRKSPSSSTPNGLRLKPRWEEEAEEDEEAPPRRNTSTGFRARMSHRVISPPFVL